MNGMDALTLTEMQLLIPCKLIVFCSMIYLSLCCHFETHPVYFLDCSFLSVHMHISQYSSLFLAVISFLGILCRLRNK